MIPDGEKIVAGHLRADPTISGLDARVVGKTPGSIVDPWVRVTLLDASDDFQGSIEHLVTYMLQCDCYAGEDGGQPEANTLARTVRASLKAMQGSTTADATISAVRFAGMARIPDTDFEPARERVVITAVVIAHG